ncbi:MAG: methionyl-tRNA formyltransferase, partial [Lachnospiraceae bacterium]|nr:methionyl-tRNA formyltransferase [Lachnospiraceae bacterium]
DADVLAENSGAEPGTVVRTDKAAIYVACGQGTLALKEVQIEGKKRMPVSAFLLGYHVKAGDILG